MSTLRLIDHGTGRTHRIMARTGQPMLPDWLARAQAIDNEIAELKARIITYRARDAAAQARVDALPRCPACESRSCYGECPEMRR